MKDQNTPTNTLRELEKYMREMNIDYAVIQQVQGLVSEAVNKARIDELQIFKKSHDWNFLGNRTFDNRIRELETPNQVEGE